MSKLAIGLQLYTVRDQTAQDFRATIRAVAQMGYTGVEFAGYGDLSPTEVAALLQETGLQAAGTHVRFATLEQDLDGEIAYCLAIGCPYLVAPSLPREQYSAEGFRALAPRMNEIGSLCHERGITFVFHNHYDEFKRSNGSYLLDLLLDATDPALVKLELDTYWAAYAGVDPIAYLNRRAGRVPLIHLKDMTPERSFTEVGAGTLDIPGYQQAAQNAGTRWYIVENDAPVLPSLESARRSVEYLRTLD
jgi:sugar phosphate isomerase/epimerase